MTQFAVAPSPQEAIAQDPVLGLVFAHERPQDAPAVDALVDRAFGPGRFAKTAERVREASHLRHDLSICAWRGENLVGAVRQWPVAIGAASAVFLGPIAVDASERSQGVGAALMRRAVEAAETAGEGIVLLVGDLPFFGQFGFQAVEPGRVEMPGPVDSRRLLWRALRGHTLDGMGGRVGRPRGA